MHCTGCRRGGYNPHDRQNAGTDQHSAHAGLYRRRGLPREGEWGGGGVGYIGLVLSTDTALGCCRRFETGQASKSASFSPAELEKYSIRISSSIRLSVWGMPKIQIRLHDPAVKCGSSQGAEIDVNILLYIAR